MRAAFHSYIAKECIYTHLQLVAKLSEWNNRILLMDDRVDAPLGPPSSSYVENGLKDANLEPASSGNRKKGLKDKRIGLAEKTHEPTLNEKNFLVAHFAWQTASLLLVNLTKRRLISVCWFRCCKRYCSGLDELTCFECHATYLWYLKSLEVNLGPNIPSPIDMLEETKSKKRHKGGRIFKRDLYMRG